MTNIVKRREYYRWPHWSPTYHIYRFTLHFFL